MTFSVLTLVGAIVLLLAIASVLLAKPRKDGVSPAFMNSDQISFLYPIVPMLLGVIGRALIFS